MIKFNEITWYSKLAAIIFFIGVLPTLTFYIGVQYQKTVQSEESVSIQNTPAKVIKPTSRELESRRKAISLFEVADLLKVKYKLVDVNFDGVDDIQHILDEEEGGTDRHQTFDYFLFNAETKQYEFNQEFTDTEGLPNPKTQEISAGWIGGCAGQCYTEKIYKVKDNKPFLAKEIKQSLLDFYDTNSPLVRVEKKLVDGSFVTSTTTIKTN